MAMTYEDAKKIAMKSAQGAGVDTTKIPIDENYIRAIQSNSLKEYGDTAIAQGKRNRDEGIGVLGSATKLRDENYERPSMSGISSSDLANAQRKKAISAIENAYGMSSSALEQERMKLDPAFRQQESEARKRSIMNAKDFENFLATKGIGASGAASQGEIARTIGLQGQLGQIGQQRMDAMADIERRQSELAQQSEFQKGQTMSDFEIANLQSQLTEQQRAQSTEGQLTPIQQRELQTIGQYSNDFQAEINRRRATPDTADDYLIPYLASARQDKIAQLGLDQQGRLAQAPVQQVPTLTPSNALSLWKQIGTANEAVSKALGIAVGTRYGGTSTGSSGTKSTSTKTTSSVNDWFND
jgi:hypothetical protein